MCSDTAFQTYFACVYDDIYRDKDYDAEVETLETVFEDCGRVPERILDLGCGTGSHAVRLADRGYTVTGIDKAAEMIQTARKKATEWGVEENVSFEQVPIQDYSADEQYDCAIAQFSVIGYLTENNQFEQALTRTKKNLCSNGLFVFDSWYGPAVLRIWPETRLKRIQLDESTIYRYAIPKVHTEQNVVDIEYETLHIDEERILGNGTETHSIRYFFKPEIEQFCSQTGCLLKDVHPLGNPAEQIDDSTWNVSWVIET